MPKRVTSGEWGQDWRTCLMSPCSPALEEAQLPQDRVQLFITGYQHLSATIRKDLLRMSPGFPGLVGVEWRLDNYMKSDALERVKAPTYFVKLKTRVAGGAEKDVEFTCNFQELQDMLAKAKDAVRVVERMSGGK